MFVSSSSNSLSDSFYDISIESNTNVDSENSQNSVINPISNIKTLIIIVLLISLVGYIIYNYYDEIVGGLNKKIL